MQAGPFISRGYYGQFIEQLKALSELKDMPISDHPKPVAMVLDPGCAIPGDYGRVINNAGSTANVSQQESINGLKLAVEKIQGPPGTGKPTTICGILEQRVPKGEQVMITCARNVAVESIASKLEHKNKWRLCVFGQAERVGEVAKRHLLSEQVGRCFDVLKNLRKRRRIFCNCPEFLRTPLTSAKTGSRDASGRSGSRASSEGGIPLSIHVGVYAMR